MLDLSNDLATRPHSISESESNIDAFTVAVRDAVLSTLVDASATDPIAYADKHAERIADELARAYCEVYGVDPRRDAADCRSVVNGYAYAVDPSRRRELCTAATHRRPDLRTGTID